MSVLGVDFHTGRSSSEDGEQVSKFTPNTKSEESWIHSHPYQTLAIVLGYKLFLGQCPMEAAGAGGWVGKMFVVQCENVRSIISSIHVESR